MLNTKYKLTIFNTYLDQRLICRKYKQCRLHDVYYFYNLQDYWLFLIFSIISRSVISLSQGLSNARLESWAWGTSTLIWRDWDPKTTSGSATQQPVIWRARMSSSRSSLKVNTSHLLSFPLLLILNIIHLHVYHTYGCYQTKRDSKLFKYLKNRFLLVYRHFC